MLNNIKIRIKPLLPLLLLLALPRSGWAQFTFTTNSGAITITGYTGSGGNVTIPSATNGYPVTTIGTNAFYNVKTMTGVIIPDSVTSIRYQAFYYCSSLTSLSIGNGVTNIGDDAFLLCYNLTSLTIPNSVITIGDNNNDEDGYGAFGECDSLRSVTIGNSVTSIGAGTFIYCFDLTSVTIPDSVTNLGQFAFYDCNQLINITIGSGVTSIGPNAFNNCADLTSVTIGNSVTSIGEYAFFACPRLTSVTIPDSVTSIGFGAFEDCYDMTNALFLGNAPSVNGGAGSNDTSVFYGESGTAHYLQGATGWGATFGGWPTAAQILPPPTDITWTTNSGAITITGYTGSGGNVTIPSTINGYPVTAIEAYAFWNQQTLTGVAIPKSVTSIGAEAFGDCLSLTNIAVNAGNASYASAGGVLFDKAMTMLIQYPASLAGSSYAISNGVTSIDDYAFFDCDHLTSVTIPASVASIGYSAFEYCQSLTSITIPASVTSIGGYAFYYCSDLHQAYFQGNAPSVNGGAGSADNTVFGGESGTAYYLQGATGWGATFGGWPTAQWFLPNPQILNNSPGFGVQPGGFGFTIAWATNTSVVVEACTNLANPAWIPVSTNTLIGGTNYFSDPQWTNYPARFYRLRSP
ncbi:MAG: leucine-rich repeat domain-containing protein [Verrucomicrobiota bacterium]